MNDLEQRLGDAEKKGKVQPFIDKFQNLVREIEGAGIKVVPMITTTTRLVNGIVIQELENVRYSFSLMTPEEQRNVIANRKRDDDENKERLDKARVEEGK